ncbi:hypothetical protein AB0C34_13455 [Nocardia sp. NPDC049220]|uniref:MmyB family transcriptional regulator n=1 Tax=Nocardia sp. NPDC049220 TaxID=3155273 RepID=UPI0033E947B1
MKTITRASWPPENAPAQPAVPSRTVRPGGDFCWRTPRTPLARTACTFRRYRLLAGRAAQPRSLLLPAPGDRELFTNWNTQIRGCVARLSALAGTDLDAPDLAQLVGDLLLKSEVFARP